MSTTPDNVHLSNNHRDTLGKLFEHPLSHNIEWQAVLSLLEAVGKVERHHDGAYVVTVGEETETFRRPRSKDIDAQEVIDVRRMLANAGYGPETAKET
jgi:hypothetical protein